MNTAIAKKTAPSVEIVDNKSLGLMKKARKAMCKLKRRSIKTPNTTALVYADRLIEIFNSMLDEQKTARKAAKATKAAKFA